MINPFGNKVGYKNIWLCVHVLTFFFFFCLSLNPDCAKMCYFLILCRRVEIFIFSIFLSWESKENQHVSYKVLKWINLTWSMAIISATYKLFIYIMGGH